MILRPGRRLLVAAAIATVLGVFAFLWGPILWFLGAALLVVAGLAASDARRAAAALERISVSRSLPKVVGRNVPFADSLKLTNGGASSVEGEVRDVLPYGCEPVWNMSDFRLPPAASVELPTDCRIPIRGLHRFGPVWIRVRGPLGLVEVQREFDCCQEVKVLPETFVSREKLQKDLKAQLQMLDKVSRSRQHGSGAEFVTLDEFRRGDDPRRIDWRATARHGHPIVRRYQVERHRDVLILIDSGRLMGAMTDRGSKLDCAVDAGLNLARVALGNGDRCGIAVFDSAFRGYLRPTAGPKTLRNLVDCAYDLQTQWRETDFTQVYAELQHKQAKRCLLVVLSDLGDAETSRMHCRALERLSRRHLLLFAALRTPLLDRVIHGETATVLDGAKKAVAMGLSRDRGRALHLLQHGGVSVIDVEPQDLVVPLINKFIELRQRNLL